MLKTTNGYWIVRAPVDGKEYRTRLFWGSRVRYPIGSKVSVAAYTRSNKNITRIPLVISFSYEDEDQYFEIEKEAVQFLCKAFNIYTVLYSEYKRGNIIEHIYVYDDKHICENLYIEHDLYIKKYNRFIDVIKIFLYMHKIYKFEIYGVDKWMYIRMNTEYRQIKQLKHYRYLDFFLYMINSLSKEMNCKYIDRFIDDIFRRGIIDILLMLRNFNDKIENMILYYMYFNLYEVGKGLIDNEVNKRYKNRKWNCLTDCKYRCGLKSPLHAIQNVDKMRSNSYIQVREKYKIHPTDTFTSIILLFGSCHLLRQKKFFLNGKQFHMGVLAYILPSRRNDVDSLEPLSSVYSDILSDVDDDISLIGIRNLRKCKGFSSIFSISSKSSFLKSLRNRSPNYRERILALRDAIPFLSSKEREQRKLNILQYITYDLLEGIFSYRPLSETGFLERSIVFTESEFSQNYVYDNLKKIAKFSESSGDIIAIDFNLDEIEHRFMYNFDEDKTLFSKAGIKKFYVKISLLYIAMYHIIYNYWSDNAENIMINNEVIDRACSFSKTIIKDRDDILFRLTKQYRLFKSIKNFLERSKEEFFYWRDLQRRYSSYSSTSLKKVINILIHNRYIEEITVHNEMNKKEIIIYRINDYSHINNI